jgi:hypothetical protein
MTLSKADEAILEMAILEFTPPSPVDDWPPPVAGRSYSPTPRPVPGGAGAGASERIPLQFPPKIKGNSKASLWKKTDQASYEPVVVFLGASETKLSIELKYVVGMMGWTVNSVARAVHMIMGYFYRTVLEGTNGAPLIKITLYKVAPAGNQISHWRMDDANVSQSEELILEGTDVYPLVTTVSMNLAMVTQIGDVLSQAQASTMGVKKQAISIAPKYPLKEWY